MAAVPQTGDEPFEVVLNSLDESYLVPADKTILDVLIEAGKDPLHDCKRGSWASPRLLIKGRAQVAASSIARRKSASAFHVIGTMQFSADGHTRRTPA
jgi:hypothetical protein